MSLGFCRLVELGRRMLDILRFFLGFHGLFFFSSYVLFFLPPVLQQLLPVIWGFSLLFSLLFLQPRATCSYVLFCLPSFCGCQICQLGFSLDFFFPCLDGENSPLPAACCQSTCHLFLLSFTPENGTRLKQERWEMHRARVRACPDKCTTNFPDPSPPKCQNCPTMKTNTPNASL